MTEYGEKHIQEAFHKTADALGVSFGDYAGRQYDYAKEYSKIWGE